MNASKQICSNNLKLPKAEELFTALIMLAAMTVAVVIVASFRVLAPGDKVDK